MLVLNHSRLKYELEVAYFFGQIILYRPFLHYLSDLANGVPVDRRQSQRALTCIRVASVAITRSDFIFQRGWLHPASWMSLYTTFISVVCLFFLMATRKERDQPVEAWKKAQQGIRILAGTLCEDNGSSHCLHLLKVSPIPRLTGRVIKFHGIDHRSSS